MKLIVGLGNIGREYENTRHNIGFMVVDELARRLGVSFGKEDRSAYMAEYRAPEKIIIIKPTTYMNLSGVAVGAYANFPPAAAKILLKAGSTGTAHSRFGFTVEVIQIGSTYIYIALLNVLA